MNHSRIAFTRRDVLKIGALVVGTSALKSIAPAYAEGAATITLPALPYTEDALAPVISANTMSFHYGKHHRGYVDNLNKLIAETELANASLELLAKKHAGIPGQQGRFKHATKY